MSKPLDTGLIKTPHAQVSYTAEQIEQVRLCADPVTGPEYFCSNFFRIQHPIRGSIQYVPYEFQRELLSTYHNHRYVIAMLGRQLGKTTTAAGYLLWYAMFVPDSTILVAAHKFVGAQEIMQRIRYAYEMCPDHIRAGVTSYNRGSIEFDNGSRILSQTTTETTGRGLSISLLYSDEFAYVRPSIARAFYASISPTLSTGGKAIFTSTPSTDEDQFAEIWHGACRCTDEYGMPTQLGSNGFRAYSAIWSAHPERDAAWAAAERARLGEERFRREHECEFISADETLISGSRLLQLRSQTPIQVQAQVRWYSKPKPACVYVLALDPSLGTGGDAAALQLFELPGFRQVAEWQHNRTAVQGQIRLMQELLQQLKSQVPEQNLYYSVENNSVGEAALVAVSELGEENLPGSFLSESGTRRRRGYTTTNKSKMAACAQLKHLLESDQMQLCSQNLISELKTFVSSGAGFAAKPGESDDLVMALLLVVRMAQDLRHYLPEAQLQASAESETLMPLPFIMS